MVIQQLVVRGTIGKSEITEALANEEFQKHFETHPVGIELLENNYMCVEAEIVDASEEDVYCVELVYE